MTQSSQDNPRWQTVLFDLDGTLCNTIPLILASFQHAFREVTGEGVDEDVARSWIGLTLATTFAPYPQAAELEASYRRFNEANLTALQTNFDGIPELLRELKDARVRTGIVTAKRRHVAMMSLDASGITDDIELVCAMDDTDKHKPDPTPLLLGLERMGVGREGAVYIGDAVVDLQAAAAAGIDGIGVTWGAGTPADLSLQPHVALCNTTDELARVLLG